MTTVLKGAEVALDVCLLGYAGSSLAIALASLDMDVSSVSIHPCFLSATYQQRVDWRNPANRVPPRQPPRANPGRCTQQQHDTLQDIVNIACKMKWSCSPGDGCALLGIKTADGAACVAARIGIETACYDFSDPGHLDQLAQETARVQKCHSSMAARRCPGYE